MSLDNDSVLFVSPTPPSISIAAGETPEIAIFDPSRRKNPLASNSGMQCSLFDMQIQHGIREMVVTIKTKRVKLEEIVDLHRYPLNDPDAPAYKEAVAEARSGLEKIGCVRLCGFLIPESVAGMAAETRERLDLVDRTVDLHNPYFSEPDESLSEDHPQRILSTRTNAFLCCDRIPRTSLIWQLYESEYLRAFLQACLNFEALYIYQDPMAAMLVNVQEDGAEFPWHFDSNEFSVSIMLQQPDSGGVFQFSPGIRSPEDENYEGVAEVLKGQSDRVITLDLKPGDLQLFKGRYSLHRVTAVRGPNPRFMAIFGYTLTPDMVAKPGRVMKLFGRVHSGHLDGQPNTHRSDALID